MSVVFDFNDSLNDVAPMAPIPLPVEKRFNILRQAESRIKHAIGYIKPYNSGLAFSREQCLSQELHPQPYILP